MGGQHARRRHDELLAEEQLPRRSENLHLIERFTRAAPDTIRYEFTVDDPTTWTKPWTAMIPLRRSDGLIYEYACHEGNQGWQAF